MQIVLVSIRDICPTTKELHEFFILKPATTTKTEKKNTQKTQVMVFFDNPQQVDFLLNQESRKKSAGSEEMEKRYRR